MKVITYIKVRVIEPFSGGSLKIFDCGEQVLPSIYLRHLWPPEYPGVSPELAKYDRAHRVKDSYEILFISEDLPFIKVFNPTWQLEGKPKKNATVDIGTRDI